MFHKQVRKAGCAFLVQVAILFPLVQRKLDRLPLDTSPVKSLNCQCSVLRLFKLDIAETLAASIWERLKFSGLDRPKGFEHLVELVLGHFFRQVAHKYVGHRVEVFALSLHRQSDGLALQFLIVHLLVATIHLGLVRETYETIL